MQYQKLSDEQKSVRSYRLRLAHRVCQIMDQDKNISREAALTQARKELKPRNKKRRSKYRKPKHAGALAQMKRDQATHKKNCD